MKFLFSSLLLSLLLPFSTIAQEELNIASAHDMWSDSLAEQRSYWVQLPVGYETQPDRKYNLAIVLDGNSHFIPAAGVFRFMARFNRIPETIVVGIKNVDRNRDYTPDKIETVRKNNFGGADNFQYFLEKELVPTLEKSYRINDQRLLAGHSLGGLFATHTYLKGTTTFTHFIAIDPSLGFWDNALMTEKVAAVGSEAFERKIYMASANSGNRKDRNEERHLLLFEKLAEIGQKKSISKLEYFEDEVHRTVPLLAWYHGLKFLFKE